MFFLRIIGSIFLISGTSIGAGMLGLPIKVLGVSFFLNFLIFLFLWLVMVFSSIAMLEISFWVKGNENIVSISKYIFGNFFSKFISFFYIFFLYALNSAYISAGAAVLTDLFFFDLIYRNIDVLICFIFILPFSFFLFFGISFIDFINRFFFIILICSYFFLILNLFKFSKQNISYLQFLNFDMLFFAFPIMVTSFGYSLLLPSLKVYLFNNFRLLFFVVLIGSLIPFIVYIFWEYFINCFFVGMGNKLYIQTIFSVGNPTEKILAIISNDNSFVFYAVLIFSFFAVLSSFIGVSLSLYDFLFDFFIFSKLNIFHKFFVNFFVFLLPVFFNLIYPYSFMIALTYAGVFAAVLLILFPIYTLWYGRYIKCLKYKYFILDNRFFLYFLFFIGLLVVFFDLFDKYFI